MLKLYLLGPPRAELAGEPLDIRRRKALALLVYLAVSGQPHSRDAMATLFYPDLDQSRARAYFRRDLGSLNSQLKGGWLATDRERVGLNSAAETWIDIIHFRSCLADCRQHNHPEKEPCADCLSLLATAAELYTDHFLAGFSLTDCPEFDDWQFFEAEGLRQELAMVLERLVQGYSNLDRPEAAIPYARRWLALDPLHEPVHRELMRLYAQADQQAAALRQYEECVRILDEELGLPPEEDTTTLYEAIKAKRLVEPLLRRHTPGRETPRDHKIRVIPEARPQNCSNCGAENPSGSRFCRQCGTPFGRTPDPVPPAKLAAAPPLEERRWVTVLFAEISDFSAITGQMDPEDVIILADRCTRRLGQEVQRFEGTVINVSGNGLLAAFGAPLAHEDDPERAVRTGLAMARLNLATEPEQTIRVQVAINSGEVYAGLMGPQERREYTVMGDTVNTAVGLLSAAPAGSVIVGQATYQATRQTITYQARPPIEARGKAEPVPAWTALDVVPLSQSRSPAATPFIGRDQELERLLAMWRWVADNRQPQLVTILGEAGLGKSRLVAEFTERLPGLVTVLQGDCLPYGEALSYGAMAMILKEAAAITADGDAGTALTKLTGLVAEVISPDGAAGDPQEIAQHLALISGLDIATDQQAGARDERVVRLSVRRFLTAFALRYPLCLIFDDIHWANESLLDLIEYLAANCQDVPLFILTLSRPLLLEKRTSWGRGVPSFTSLALQTLTAPAEQALILALCRQYGLEDTVAGQISHSAGGNPLFAEELVAMVAEQGQKSGIPVAIKLLISARLDTLPVEEKQTLQIAAVFGSLFWEGGLQSLTTFDATDQLEALARKGLLRAHLRSQYPGQQEYTFKHDLIREVAYDMLPRSERRSRHGQVADWLEQTAGEQLPTHLDLIAHHLVEAGQPERAIPYLVQAAEKAGRATAHHQEADLLLNAISIARQIERHDLLAGLHTKRGQAFIDLGLWREAQQELVAALATLDDEALEQRIHILTDLAWVRFWLVDLSGQSEAANAAMELAETVDQDDLLAKAMFAVGFSRMNDAELQATQELCRGALERAGDAAPMELSMAAWASGIVSYWHGNFPEAVAYLDRAVQMGHNQHHTVPTAIALPQLGLALAAEGRYAEAEEVFERARQFGRDYELWPFLSRILAMASGYHLDLFDYDGHAEIAGEARELGLSLAFPPPTLSASIDLLLNYARRHMVGPYEQLIEQVAEFVEGAPGFHGWLWRSRLAEAQAEIALVRADWEEALRWASLGIERSRNFGRPKYEALGLESHAQALLKLNRSHEAITDLQQATDLARTIGDPAIFLRIACSLLVVAGNDALLAETQAIVQRIRAAIPTEALLAHFEAAEPVQFLAKF